MKIRKIFKNIKLGLFCGLPVTFLSAMPSFNFLKNNSLTKTSNSLKLNITNSDGFNQVDFKNYNHSKNYDIYVKKDQLNEMVKKVIISIFQNNWDFYYDGVKEIAKDLDIYNKKYYVYIYTSTKNENNKLLFNFTYIVKSGTCCTLSANDVDLVNAINLVEDKINNYYYAYVDFRVISGLIFGIFGYEPSDITKPVEAKNMPYNHKIFDLWGTFPLYFDMGAERLKISFPNIKFHVLDDYYNNQVYINKNALNLREEDIKSSFSINGLVPYDISYSTSSLPYGDLCADVKSISFEINNSIQKFKFHYIGTYKLFFSKPNFEISTLIIQEQLNIYSLTNELFLQNVIIDENYKKLIKEITINKQYVKNIATVNIIFDLNQVNRLSFSYELKNEFTAKKIEINFAEKEKIFFDFSKIENNLYENFNVNNLRIYFNDETNKNISIKNIVYENKDNQTKTISIKIELEIVYKNQKFSDFVTFIFDKFLSYEFKNFEKFINENFYDQNNIFLVEKFLNFFTNNDSWNNILIFDEGLNFKNMSVIENENTLDFSFEIYNIFNDLLKIEKITLDKLHKKEPEPPVVENPNPDDNNNNGNVTTPEDKPETGEGNENDNNENQDDTIKPNEPIKDDNKFNNKSRYQWFHYLYLVLIICSGLISIFVLYKIIKKIKKKNQNKIKI